MGMFGGDGGEGRMIKTLRALVEDWGGIVKFRQSA